MKKYRNGLKRAAAFALSTMLVASGAAVSADDFTSYEEGAVFAEDPSFGNEEADFPSTDDMVFEETDSGSEAADSVSEAIDFVSEDADFISEDVDFVSEETIDETVVTEEVSHEGSPDVSSTENTIDEGNIVENIGPDDYIGDVSSVEGTDTPAAVVIVTSVPFLRRSWNPDTNQVETTTDYCSNYQKYYGKTETLSGWYLVEGYVSVDDRLIVSGTANIILCDGAKLYCKDGINVKAGNTLNIYCQQNETGELYCDADTNDNAAIGADDEDGDCGTVNIHGGRITADAENLGTEGAGIGGGDEGDGGNVTIYGGTVKAIGAKFAAGIGGGDADNEGGRGGTTIIYGGNVTAIGGTDAAGIGGGEGGNGGTVEIWGGTVTATSGTNSAGIGGGEYGNGGKITINGGTVTATSVNDGAGIGGGDEGDGGTITINGGTVKATGGEQGAGIGGGDGGNGGTITINGGNVTATSTGEAAAIGGGDYGDSGMITITGGTVEAVGNSEGAAIGSGFGERVLSRSRSFTGTIRIEGGNVTARFTSGKPDGAAIGSGRKSPMTGTIIISGGVVNATSVEGAAIGSGHHENMEGTITITGGEVKAVSGSEYAITSGAAIGAGGCVFEDSLYNGGDCTGRITIEGGTVEATTKMGRDTSIKYPPEAIGHGQAHRLKDGTLNIADYLRVTSGQSDSSANPQSYENRVNGCRMLYTKVEPCTDHTFSNTAVQDSDGKYRYHCTLCNFAEDATDPLTVVQYKKKTNCNYSELRKKNDVIRDFMTITGVAGELSFTMTSVRRQEDGRSCRKNFKVSATDGSITVLKGIKKGTYKVKMRVSASGDGEYKPGEKYIAVYVTVA